MPRLHCLTLAILPDMFLVYPERQYWTEHLKALRSWSMRLPSRVIHRVKRAGSR